MQYLQALRVVRRGKKDKTPMPNIVAASRVVNERRNRSRVLRLKRMGYSDVEAKKIVYAVPQ